MYIFCDYLIYFYNYEMITFKISTKKSFNWGGRANTVTLTNSLILWFSFHSGSYICNIKNQYHNCKRELVTITTHFHTYLVYWVCQTLGSLFINPFFWFCKLFQLSIKFMIHCKKKWVSKNIIMMSLKHWPRPK